MSKRDHKKEPAATDSSVPLTRQISLWILAVLHLVCPLIIFTNLTRNPYYTQIALLNIAISLCAILWAVEVWRSGVWRLPRTSFEWPLVLFLVVAFVSTLVSWVVHAPLRPGIQYEGTRIWVFTLANSCLAFYLPLILTKPLSQSTKSISIWTDIVVAFVWGGM